MKSTVVIAITRLRNRGRMSSSCIQQSRLVKLPIDFRDRGGIYQPTRFEPNGIFTSALRPPFRLRFAQAKKSRWVSPALFQLFAGCRDRTLKEREPSQARMPLLPNLFLYRKTGCGNSRMGGAPFGRFRIHRANQVVDDRLFPYVASPCTTSRQGDFGHP